MVIPRVLELINGSAPSTVQWHVCHLPHNGVAGAERNVGMAQHKNIIDPYLDEPVILPDGIENRMELYPIPDSPLDGDCAYIVVPILRAGRAVP